MDVESDEKELLEDLHIEGVAPIVRRHVEAYAAMKGIKPADALMLLVQAGYDYLTPGGLPDVVLRSPASGAGRDGKKGVSHTFLQSSGKMSVRLCQIVLQLRSYGDMATTQTQLGHLTEHVHIPLLLSHLIDSSLRYHHRRYGQK